MGITNSAIAGFIIAAIVVVGFIFLYNYSTGVMPGAKLVISSPTTQSSGVGENEAKFMFFYTTWCPYSRKAETPWKSFQELVKNQPRTYGTTRLVFEDVNAESQVAKAALYGINQYPTFKIHANDSVYEYVGAPTVDNFRQALIATFGKETF